jgi:hypothetical protein
MCIACGQDCSNKPRTKDGSGKYTCKECFDKAAAKRAAAPPPQAAPKPAPKLSRPAAPIAAAPGEDDVMAALLKDSAPTALTETCPSCGSGMTAGAVVCTICGYNKETGRAVALVIDKGPSKAAEAMLGAASAVGGIAAKGAAASMSPLTVFLICLGVFSAPPILMISAPDTAAVAQGISALFSLIVFIFTLVAGFRTSVATGFILLVTMFIPFVNLYWLYFVFSVNENGSLKAAWAANLISILVMIFAVFSKM